MQALPITSLSTEPYWGLAFMSGQMKFCQVGWRVILNNLNNIESLKWRKNYTHQFSELSDKEVWASLQRVLNCVAIAQATQLCGQDRICLFFLPIISRPASFHPRSQFAYLICMFSPEPSLSSSYYCSVHVKGRHRILKLALRGSRIAPAFFFSSQVAKSHHRKKAVLLIDRTNVGWFFLFQRTSGPGFDT